MTDPLVGATHDDRFLLADGTALHFSDALRLGIDRAGLTLDLCDTVCVAKRAGAHASPRAAKLDASPSAADSPA